MEILEILFRSRKGPVAFNNDPRFQYMLSTAVTFDLPLVRILNAYKRI